MFGIQIFCETNSKIWFTKTFFQVVESSSFCSCLIVIAIYTAKDSQADTGTKDQYTAGNLF